MKILTDEEIVKATDNEKDRMKAFGHEPGWKDLAHAIAFAQDKDTLRQVRVLLDGMKKSCNCGSPLCPADTWEKAIQTMKALLEGKIDRGREDKTMIEKMKILSDGVKEILVKQCQTHEHRGCNCTPQDADDCWGAIALQICQLSQEKVEQTVKDDADRCAGYLKLARAECQEKVERIFKEIEKFAVEFPRYTISELLDGEWWQALKKEGVK